MPARAPVRIEWARGRAGEFHARDVPDDGAVHVWSLEVDRPAVVLGSRQGDEILDRAACAAAGVEVVHRRSGGGAVLLVPGEVVWVDVIVPAGDPRLTDDLPASMRWLGGLWVAALSDVGVGAGTGGDGRSALHVHSGGLERTPWSELVCFAGVGPGEVLLSGRKLVGISQRRTRRAARFQCALHRHGDPAALRALLAPPTPDPAALESPAHLPPGIDAGALVAALAAALHAA